MASRLLCEGYAMDCRYPHIIQNYICGVIEGYPSEPSRYLATISPIQGNYYPPENALNFYATGISSELTRMP
jgi:hypothetical protein